MRYTLAMKGLYFIIPTLALFLALTALAQGIQLQNPLRYNTVQELIDNLINWLFTLALVIVPLIIVLAGYFFIASGGDPQKVTQARNMVIYALVGFLIILASKGMIALVETIVGVR